MYDQLKGFTAKIQPFTRNMRNFTTPINVSVVYKNKWSKMTYDEN